MNSQGCQRLIKKIYSVGAALATLAIVVLNLRLYAPGAAAYTPGRLGPDTVPQLRFIAAALAQGAGEEMQGLFPEGDFFTRVLYGLSWVEVGLREQPGSTLHAEALREARRALAYLESAGGRAPFSPDLDPPYGVFYLGWLNWLRGGILLMQPDSARDPAEVERFEADCALLARAFDLSPTPFLASYPRQAWPVDSVVAIAVLRLHDRLLSPRFDSTIETWLPAARARLDPATGLLPHRADWQTGEPIEVARGSSQSVIARFLPEVDPAWGRDQYRLFREQFVRPFLGVPGVREYPEAVDGRGDVDSGPLVYGFSASATVVTIGAAQVNGDFEVVNALLPASEAVGLPIHFGESKRYAFGLMPVGDAFLAWAKTSQPWVAPRESGAWARIVSPGWRLPFHAASLALITLTWWPVRRRRTHL
jgi:hypothetical protein